MDTKSEQVEAVAAAETAGPAPASRFGTPARIVLGIAVVLSVAVVIVAQAWQIGQPKLPGRENTAAITGFIAGPLEWIAALAALGTVGSLLSVAWGYRHPQRGAGWKLSHRDYRLLATARRFASVWAIAAIVLIPISAADTAGDPIPCVLGALGDYLSANQNTQAWLLIAVTAGALAIGCWLSTTWRWVIGMTILSVLASLPTVVTAQVSVGTGHDLATDAAIIFTLATTLWFAAIWATRATADGIGAHRAFLRTARVGAVAVVVALISRAGIGIFEQAGQSPLTSPYGVGILTILAILMVLGIRTLLRWRAVRALDDEPTRRVITANGIDLALVILLLGVQAALLRLIPARYPAPQTPTQNYLGYNVPHPPQVSLAFLPGRPNLLLLTVSVVMIGLYAWGYVRVRRAGNAWPVNRLLCWTAGWLMVVVLIGSRMWTYSSATFSWHMVVHMTLNMGAPVLMVLGGPITLMLRTSKAHGAGQPVGLHDVVSQVLSWRLVAVLLNPILVWLIFVGSLYILYFSPLFGLAMRYHWAHQLMAVHFLVIGYLFYWLVIGVDRPPRSLPHIAKLGYIFAAMPFHAFFAVAVLSGGAIIGQDFYTLLDLPWLHDLAAQQRAGGQVTWATGEIPLFIVIIALVGQWFAHDTREAKRKDRAADAGHDDSLAAYNEMLAALAARDRSQQQRAAVRDDHQDDRQDDHQDGGVRS
ncbi:copper resistance protein D [Microlunatus endophyticus]|uniref:Copper resistance protein D n=1 Tax=Microlunatus endophyticus TaxID=1716077 RepID=A0A917W6B9_9ACTN|nr:cytochrome c oxidase assembly protein [Microlunatus endophyticus]GGL74084.1 copper resistance protein D [Microlunatus endophyticus]